MGYFINIIRNLLRDRTSESLQLYQLHFGDIEYKESKLCVIPQHNLIMFSKYEKRKTQEKFNKNFS